MKTPFTVEQFLGVFKQYNTTVWPMQLLLFLLACTALFLALKKNNTYCKVIMVILSFLWLWMGFVYHLIFFSSINKAAYMFGGLFIIQGAVFLINGAFKGGISFQWKPDVFGITGVALMMYALILYPVLSYLMGHRYPDTPTFGLPCPTTIFTLGILLLVKQKVSWAILLIPFLWSLIGFSAAISLGIYEDISLVIAGLLVVFMRIIKNRSIINSERITKLAM